MSSSNRDPWQVVMRTLVNRDVEISVQDEKENEETVTLTVSDESEGRLIERRIKEALYNKTNYSSYEVTQATDVNAVNAVSARNQALIQLGFSNVPPKNDLSLGRQVLRKLSNNPSSMMGMSLLFQYSNNCSLLSMPAKKNDSSACDDLLAVQSQIVSTLSGGVLKDKPQMVEKCVYMRIVPHQTEQLAYIVFDYGLLYQLLSPLQITFQAQTRKISFNKRHMIAQLIQNHPHGVMLDVTKTSVDADQLQVTPAFLAVKDTIEKPRLCVFYVDNSSSMSGHFSELKQRLIEFVKHIAKHDSKTALEIRFFNDSHEDLRFINLNDIGNIESQINSISTKGSTSLYSYAAEALDKASSWAEKYNTTVFFITDGENTTLTSLKETFDHSTTNYQDATYKPYWFVMGHGNGYDRPTLEAIAKSTGVQYQHLNGSADVSNVIDTVKSRAWVNSDKAVKEFCYAVGELSKKNIIPVKIDGNPYIDPALVIPVPINKPTFEMQVDQNPYQVTINPNYVPVVGADGKLSRINERVNVNDEKQLGAQSSSTDSNYTALVTAALSREEEDRIKESAKALTGSNLGVIKPASKPDEQFILVSERLRQHQNYNCP